MSLATLRSRIVKLERKRLDLLQRAVEKLGLLYREFGITEDSFPDAESRQALQQQLSFYLKQVQTLQQFTEWVEENRAD